MSRLQPRDPAKDTRLATLAEIDERFPRLPSPIPELLADQPSVFSLLVKLQSCVKLGLLPAVDLVRLVKKWTDSLPEQRGRIVDFNVQPELPLALPGKPHARTKRRRKKRLRRS